MNKSDVIYIDSHQEDTTVRCHAYRGRPPARIMWLYNDQIINGSYSTQHISGSDSSNFTFDTKSILTLTTENYHSLKYWGTSGNLSCVNSFISYLQLGAVTVRIEFHGK